MIIDKLITRIKETQNPTVVGLDPHTDIIPPELITESLTIFNDPLQAMANAVWRFNTGLIDALCDIVPAVKPQIAFYERYGSHGMECYQRTIAYAKQHGLLVIGDIKRGDIASTAEAYAEAHIGRVVEGGHTHAVFDADFVTINPYLGRDSVTPFLDQCRQHDKGLFVLVRTSNPSAGDIQDLETPNGRVFEAVGEMVSQWGKDLTGENGYSAVCAVVGATGSEQAARLREIMPHTFFLVPGYGAQGGTADSIKHCFHAGGMGAIVNNSRAIIGAYKKTGTHFAQAAREAALVMRNELSQVML